MPGFKRDINQQEVADSFIADIFQVYFLKEVLPTSVKQQKKIVETGECVVNIGKATPLSVQFVAVTINGEKTK